MFRLNCGIEGCGIRFPVSPAMVQLTLIGDRAIASFDLSDGEYRPCDAAFCGARLATLALGPAMTDRALMSVPPEHVMSVYVDPDGLPFSSVDDAPNS